MIDLDVVIEAIEMQSHGIASGVGFCLECGAEHDGVEPDAEGYECEECGAMEVCGAEQCLLNLF